MSAVGILSVPCSTCGAPADGQCETAAVTYEPRPRSPHPARIHRLPLGHRGVSAVTTETAPELETDDANEAAVQAARDAYRPAYEQGLGSDIASCADWFGWHAAIKAARAQFMTEQRDELVELRERLCVADAKLIALAGGGRTRNEVERLTGKAEGVRLAISYLDELVRGS